MTSDQKAERVFHAWNSCCTLCNAECDTKYFLGWIDVRTSEKFCTYCYPGPEEQARVRTLYEVRMGDSYYPVHISAAGRLMTVFDTTSGRILSGTRNLNDGYALIEL